MDDVIVVGNTAEIYATLGNNTISLTGENSVITTGRGLDTVTVEGSGNELVGGGNDTITANGDNSIITIGAGKNDVTATGDRLRIRSSDDALGWDQFDVRESSGSIIEGGEGRNTYWFENLTDSKVIGGDGIDRIINWEFRGDENRNNRFITKGGDDDVSVDGDELYIDVGDGDDSVNADGRDIQIIGGQGEDTIYSDGSNIEIDAGSENDNVNVSGSSEVKIDGGEGSDTIDIKSTQNAVVNGGIDNDVIIASDLYFSEIHGGDGNDFIKLRQSGHVDVFGGEGNDTIQLTGTGRDRTLFKDLHISGSEAGVGVKINQGHDTVDFRFRYVADEVELGDGFFKNEVSVGLGTPEASTFQLTSIERIKFSDATFNKDPNGKWVQE